MHKCFLLTLNIVSWCMYKMAKVKHHIHPWSNSAPYLEKVANGQQCIHTQYTSLIGLLHINSNTVSDNFCIAGNPTSCVLSFSTMWPRWCRMLLKEMKSNQNAQGKLWSVYNQGIARMILRMSHRTQVTHNLQPTVVAIHNSIKKTTLNWKLTEMTGLDSDTSAISRTWYKVCAHLVVHALVYVCNLNNTQLCVHGSIQARILSFLPINPFCALLTAISKLQRHNQSVQKQMYNSIMKCFQPQVASPLSDIW